MTEAHPQRCETCKNVDCDLHEQGKGNRNPETGYEWDHHYWYHKIIDEMGCASHSSASEPPEICCKCEDTPDVCGSDRIRCERAQAASEAREKVLDEALAEFQNINAPPVRVTYIRHVLESLRQQEGKP